MQFTAPKRLPTVVAGDHPALFPARCFLPSLKNGDVRFHVHQLNKQARNIKVFVLHFVAAQTLQGLTGTSSVKPFTLPKKDRQDLSFCQSRSLIPSPSILNPAPVYPSHPVSQMHADVFVSLSLFSSRRFAFYTCTECCKLPSSSGIIFSKSGCS